MHARSRIILILLVALLLPPAALAADVQVGQRIELKADKPAGVPLHREPRPSLAGRAPDGGTATVISLERAGRWLNIDLDDGPTAWIVDRYVGRVLPGDGQPPDGDQNAEDEFAVWTSREGCEQVVGAGRLMAERSPDTLRLATWNVRWFPDGDLDPNAGRDTDLAWLACAIAWMNLDLVALQEIRTTAKAEDAWEAVLDGLTTLRDLGNRRTALGRIDETVAGLLGRDGDVLILGDFNTMGLGDPRSEAAEQEELALPNAVAPWSLTTLREELINVGARPPPSTAPTALRCLRSAPDGRKLDHGPAALGKCRFIFTDLRSWA